MSYAKNWVFTINNPTDDDHVHLQDYAGSDDVQYLVCQLEEGESGTPHYQGYVQFISRKRLAAAKMFISNTAHMEVAKGTALQNTKYCTKEPRLEGPYTWGTMKGKGERNDLREFVEALKSRDLSEAELVDEFANVTAKFPRFVDRAIKSKYEAAVEEVPFTPRPGWQTQLSEYLDGPADNRKVRWYYDEAGKSGKSTFANGYRGKRSFVVTGGRHADIYYGYAYEPVVFFDLARVAEDKVPFEVIENFKNGYFYSTKYEPKRVRFNVPHVVIFANFTPDRSKLSADRWDVHIINENPLQINTN